MEGVESEKRQSDMPRNQRRKMRPTALSIKRKATMSQHEEEGEEPKEDLEEKREDQASVAGGGTSDSTEQKRLQGKRGISALLRVWIGVDFSRSDLSTELSYELSTRIMRPQQRKEGRVLHDEARCDGIQETT